MTWDIRIKNIAGIKSGETTIESGINAVRAGNWKGKSSFLAAIKTAMGTDTPLTEEASHGHVQLETEEAQYSVELRREDGAIVQTGTSYLTDEYDIACADLYAFLDLDNDVRTAVRNGRNLKPLLTRPLEFENIDERISDLVDERKRVDSELSSAQDAADQLPAAQQTVTQLEEQLTELRNRRETLAREETVADDIDSTRTELSSARTEREQLRKRIDQLDDTIQRAEDKLDERQTELEHLDVPDSADVESELADVQESLSDVERDAELLQSVYAANKRVLEEERLDLVADVERSLLGDTMTCWVCDQEASRDEVADRLEALGEHVTELRNEANEYKDRVTHLQDERDEVKQAEKRRRDLNDEIDDLEATVADRVESRDRVRERLSALDDEVEELSAQVAESTEELTEVESEIKYVETELEDARDQLDSLESQAGNRELLETERKELSEEITQLRNRKEKVRQRTRQAFDQAIQDILPRFGTSFETARLTSEFDLVVARNGREASLDALSEGELELLGFVAALAGYEAYSATERVPILLLDGLGGLAEQNLRELIDYLHGKAEYLVFTAYPEHESFDGSEIDPTDWTVVSSDIEKELEA